MRLTLVSIAARDSDYTNKDIEEVQTLLRSAARDCVPADRNSFVSFQANTGVEVLSFSLSFCFLRYFSIFKPICCLLYSMNMIIILVDKII